ncbi:MAG: 2-C-methyl-D-erythritol 4-phosphate cytidylyltransferase [Pirellulales bacterium]|nr:2-C-methyl-D-erythritol 4-phosphate cytidylyltransferase [Pirellulales bacterium]
MILPAAGSSSRFKDPHYKKPFAPLANRAVWIHSAERFLNRGDVVQVILVIAKADRDDFNFKFASNVAILGIDVVEGGAERGDSVEAALARLKPEAEFVCIHDAARPCLADVWIDRVFEEAQRGGAAILAIPVANTLKRVGPKGRVEETVSRDRLYEAQTPQVFSRKLIVEAYARRGGFAATDDAQLVERLGKPVTIVPGSPVNFKITTREDLRLAEQALKALPKPKLDRPAHPFADDNMWR